jgi:rhomboid protease GluP
MCRNCGSIVGGGQEQCAVCGTPVTNSATTISKPRPVTDGETLRFARAVLDRPYKFTIILLVANLFVFLLMWQASGMASAALWEFPEPVLWAFGAKLNSSISEQHQWWRFITPMFVHVNLPHVLVNMYSLWVVGPYVEKLYGSAKFVVFWVLTGIAGVVASYLTVRPSLAIGPGRFLFKANDVLSAGASGALFGLVGVLFVFGIKFRRELPEGFKRAFGTGMLPIILINLFIGYLGRGFIDNAAHLGGLVSGAILALAVDYRRPGESSGIAVTWQLLQIAAIALVAISFLKTVQHYKDPLPPSVVTGRSHVEDSGTNKFVLYAKAMNDGQEAFYLVTKDHNVGQADSAIKELEEVPSLDPKADELREKLKELVRRAKTLESPNTAPGQRVSGDTRMERQELQASFDAWRKEYEVWLKTTGKSYGFEVTERESSPK